MRAGGHDAEPGTAADLDYAIAAIIANTRRVRRKLDLVTLADCIATAQEHLGDLRAVGETVDLSEQQLRDFMKVRALARSVRKLVQERAIDSVDVVEELSKLSPRDQLTVARAFMVGDITSKDVRDVVARSSRAPDASIGAAIERVVKSRDIKEYVAEFSFENAGASPRQIRKRFERLLGARNIKSFSQPGRVGRVVLTAQGRRRLQEAANRARATKRELIEKTVEQGGT